MMSITLDAPLAKPSIGFGARFAKVPHKLRVSRMHSILAQMSDAELEAIGTTRSQIGTFAEELMRH